MTLLIPARLSHDTWLHGVGRRKGKRSGHHQLGGRGRPPRRWTGPKSSRSSMRARRLLRAQRSHDMARDRQRGRKPACDCGRCTVGGRRVLVPDERGHTEEPQCRTGSALLDRGVDPRRGRGRRGDATQVTDAGTVARIAKAWADTGWPAQPRRERHRYHRPVQRSVARTAALGRVSHRATIRDGGVGHRAGRP